MPWKESSGASDKSASLPLNALGTSLSTEESTPVAQIKFDVYPLDQIITNQTGSGSTSELDSMHTVSSGAAAGDMARSVSLRTAICRAGAGLEMKAAALFGAPVIGHRQLAGLMGATDVLAFGYDESQTFGIFRLSHGQNEIRELEITAGSVAGENTTITINGNNRIIAVPAGYSVNQVASHLATELSLVESEWVFDAVGDKVIVTAYLPFPALGAFALSGTNVDGNFSVSVAGLDMDEEFVASGDWNIRPSYPVNPQNLTSYRIAAQFLAGGITFQIEDTYTGVMEAVHFIQFSGSDTKPSVRSSNFKAGVMVENVIASSGQADVSVSNMATAIQGKQIYDASSKSEIASNVDVSNTPTNILTIKNLSHFSGQRSVSEILLGKVTATTNSNEAAIVRIIKNAAFNTPPTYEYKEIDRSIALVSTTAVEVDINSGEQIDAQSFVVCADTIDLSALNQKLSAGDTLSIVMSVSSGDNAGMGTSLTWFEDR